MVYGCAIGSFLGLQIVIARAIARDAFSGITSSPIELNTLCLIGAFASFAAYQLVFNHRSAIWSEPSETMQEAATDHSAEGDACANAEAAQALFERWDDFAALITLRLAKARCFSSSREVGAMSASKRRLSLHEERSTTICPMLIEKSVSRAGKICSTASTKPPARTRENEAITSPVSMQY